MDEELKQLLLANLQATQENTELLRDQNELLTQIVAQNADLISGMVPGDDSDTEPMTDLAGRPMT